MRTLILVTAAAFVMSAQMAAPVKAQDTTIIKKDNDAGATTVIKKRDQDRPFVAEPSTEKKVIIHKDRDDD
jgi:P pilus assembly chaperone PapD